MIKYSTVHPTVQETAMQKIYTHIGLPQQKVRRRLDLLKYLLVVQTKQAKLHQKKRQSLVLIIIG